MSHQTPRHLTDFFIGKHVSPILILILVGGILLLFVERRVHFSGANFRLFEEPIYAGKVVVLSEAGRMQGDHKRVTLGSFQVISTKVFT